MKVLLLIVLANISATSTANVGVRIIRYEDVVPSPEAVVIAWARLPSDSLYGIVVFE